MEGAALQMTEKDRKKGAEKAVDFLLCEKIVERDGGEMTTKFEPEFLLALKLPFSETEEE